MDILVKVKIPKVTPSVGVRGTHYDVDGVINLRNMTMCEPRDKKYTMVYFTSGESLLIQVRYEKFMILLEKLYGEKFIEIKDDEEKSED